MKFPKVSSSDISNESYSISDDEFHLIQGLIYAHSGIVVAEHKKSFVVGRLKKVLKNHSINNFKDYYCELLNDRSGALITELIDNISTNHTYFGREQDHFQFLQNVCLPELCHNKLNSQKNDINLWSAGCSTGEEPYTLGIILKEFLKNDSQKWNMKILATDISTIALSKAMQGVYDNSKFREFNPEWREKYFKAIDERKFEISAELKSEIIFRRFNLTSVKYPFKNYLDIIFCRNVLIYFDKEIRLKVLHNLYDTLAQGGYLFIGHAETIDRTQIKFQYIAPSIYRK